MNKEELLKEIMKLPKIETNNPISTMNSINVDDLMSAVNRLNKVPDYNDLLKENKQLKDNWNKVKNIIEDERMSHWAPGPLFLTELLISMEKIEKGESNE